jgi:hypothetical protein
MIPKLSTRVLDFGIYDDPLNMMLSESEETEANYNFSQASLGPTQSVMTKRGKNSSHHTGIDFHLPPQNLPRRHKVDTENLAVIIFGLIHLPKFLPHTHRNKICHWRWELLRD